MAILPERKPFEIEDVIIKPGTARTVMIPVGVHPNNSSYELCVRVIHGLHPGKRLFVSATMHGDEVNGIEAIHRVMTSPLIKHIHGTLIVIPIINMPGALI